MHPTQLPPRRVCSGEDHGYCCPDGVYLPQPDGTAVHRDDLDKDVTPAEILRCAALYLARHGWHQGDMFNDATQPTPAACAQGAIRMAVCGSSITSYTTHTSRHVDTAIAVLADYLHETGHIGTDGYYGALAASGIEIVGDWNDDQQRTAGEVITALRAAADDWDRYRTRRPTGSPGGAR